MINETIENADSKKQELQEVKERLKLSDNEKQILAQLEELGVVIKDAFKKAEVLNLKLFHYSSAHEQVKNYMDLCDRVHTIKNLSGFSF